MTEQDFVLNIIKYKNVLEAMLVAMVGDTHAADDLFQEAAVIMMQKRGQLDNAGSFLSWSRAIAFNVVRDFRKKRARQKVHALDDQALESIAEVFEHFEDGDVDARRSALRACSEKLSPAHRDLLRMRYDSNSSIDELAAALAKSRGALETSLYRIRKLLSDCIELRLRSMEAS